MKRWITAVAMVCALGIAAPAAAQDEEGDRETAIERLEEARERLDEALQRLREDETREARRDVERAIAELRAAERSLRGGRMSFFEFRTEPGNRLGMVMPEDMPGIVMFDSDRPRIGVIIENDGESDGINIAAVTPGGPAAEAGLKAGDVVVSANRIVVTGKDAGERFVEIIRETDEGDSLVVVYERDGERSETVIVPRPMDEENTWSYSYSFRNLADRLEGLGEGMEGYMRVAPRVEWHTEESDDPESVLLRSERGDVARAIVSRLRGGALLDLELVTVNPDLASYFGTDKGVLVVRASENNDIPLKGGDVILSIGGREPRSPSHAMRILQSYDHGEEISIEVMRDKQRQTVTMTMPDDE
jgi:C-terminal processing protease CtpA/Prc